MNRFLKKAAIAALFSSLASSALAASPEAPVPAQVSATETYAFDPDHSGLIWSISHFGFSNFSGKFSNLLGEVTLDTAHPENSKVVAAVDIDTLITGLPKLDDHLKSPDFFNRAKWNEARFTSTQIEPTGRESAKVQGMLTLHGVSSPVVLDVRLNKIGTNMMRQKTAGFSITTTIKRSDFGIDKYLPNLGDDVKIAIEVEANLKQEF